MKLWFVSKVHLFILCYFIIAVEGWICHNGDRIQDSWLCDEQTDCTDGSDELPETCPDRPCAENQFRCNNTRCIHMSFRCNGEVDCYDGDDSDEFGCPGRDADVQCKDKFLCHSGERCLPRSWKCDGERDCADSSDEFDCPCRHNTYGCYVRGASLCLNNATKCDGIKHCDDGEDEKCESISRPLENVVCPHPGMFKCRSGKMCIPWKLVCDDIDDCKDRSDEDGLCHVNDCGYQDPGKNHHTRKACEQYCHESPDGGICACGDGFTLARDGVHCQDINECNDMLYAELPRSDVRNAVKRAYEYGRKKLCSQECVNLPGGFHCTCAEGYLIDADGFTCKASGYYVPDLFVGVDNEIRAFSLRDPGDKTLYYDEVYKSDRADESIMDMDVHTAESTLFWVEDKSRQLKMKKGRDVVAVGLDFQPSAIGVDWITGNLFVSTKKKKPNHVANIPAIFLLALSVSRRRLNKVVVEILSASQLQSPVALALHPKKGLLLVADAGRSSVTGPRILITNLDGSNVRNLVTENILTPTDLVIDLANDVVFWSSEGGNGDQARVESIGLDGGRREVVLSLKQNLFPMDPISVATFEGHLYVSDNKAREVRSWKTNEIPLYGNQNTMYSSESVIKQRRSRLGSILVSHPVLQRPLAGPNPCLSAECSHICVIIPSVFLQVKELLRDVDLNARCLCPSKSRLQSDKKTCKVVTINRRIADEKRAPTSTAVQSNASTTTEPPPHCSNPGPVENAVSSPVGVLDRESFPAGATVWYSCFKGFVLHGGFAPKTEFVITCTHNGQWNAPLLECVKESIITKIIAAFEPPHLQGGRKQPRDPDVIRSRKPPEHNVIQSRNITQRTRTKSRRQICLKLGCKPWGQCVKNGSEGYKCVCGYGESTSPKGRCLPPPSTEASKNSTATTAAAAAASSTAPKSHALTPSMTALIVVAILLFVLSLMLCYRCMRKKRYSVDLRYFRGKTVKPSSNESSNRESAVIECSLNGKPTSITNPNYTSPSQRKRLPKPTFADDLSDSGIHQSFGSGSLSSTSDNSTGEGTSGSIPADASDAPSTDCPLLRDEMNHEESEVLDISEDGMTDLAKSSKQGQFRNRLGDLFKMRKTESRECMLPKKTFRRSKPSRG